MKNIKLVVLSLGVASLLSVTLLASEKAISEESLGLRKTDLYTEKDTKPVATSYSKEAPGQAKVIERSFENAPPLIPHSVDGLLPITKANNACLGCHMPDVAKSMKATPIPESHFVNFRPITKLGKDGNIVKEGKEIGKDLKNTSDIKVVEHKQKTLYQGRYNCSQCHVPQANVKPLVKNEFKAEFRNKDTKHKSNLLDTLNEGVE